MRLLSPCAKLAGADELFILDEEICRGGIESDKPLTLILHPIMYKSPLPPGQYRLRLWMADRSSTATGQRVFSVTACGKSSRLAAKPDRIDIFKETGQANRPLTRGYVVDAGPEGEVEVTLTPIVGKALLCGAVLEPVSGK